MYTLSLPLGPALIRIEPLSSTVGLAAVQIAKALGARVIATAGSQAKLDVAKKYGADFTIDYRQEGWQKLVMKYTDGHGADVVYDPVGMIVPSLKCIAWNGRLVVVGFAAGSIEKVCPSHTPALAPVQLMLTPYIVPSDPGQPAPAQERLGDGRLLGRLLDARARGRPRGVARPPRPPRVAQGQGRRV